MGPAANQLLRAILATTPERDPYDIAAAVESYLVDSNRFTYTWTSRGGLQQPRHRRVLRRTRTGYCLHFATTMAVLLRAGHPRTHPIPTRLVEGFLPGERTGSVETVRNRLAHAWVEVYFPGYGWVPFDPTGGQRPVVVPAP